MDTVTTTFPAHRIATPPAEFKPNLNQQFFWKRHLHIKYGVIPYNTFRDIDITEIIKKTA